MTARFVRDPEVGAGAAPLGPVRCDATPARAKVREQMRQLVAQSAIHFRGTVRREPRIQEHDALSVVGAAGRAAQARRPCYLHVGREGLRAQLDE